MQVSWQTTGLKVYNNWNTHNGKMSQAVQRLSSGKRINSAADDPAGLAISENMKAQLTIMARQKSIAADSISAMETAEGAMASMHSMLNRMTDLATMAASGTMSDEDRRLIDIEYQQLLEEIDMVGENTKFNGTTLFQGGASSVKVSGPGFDDITTDMPVDPIVLKDIDLNDYLDELDRFVLEWKGESSDLRNAVMDFTRDYAKKLGSTQDEKTGKLVADGGVAGGHTITVANGNIEIRQEGYSSKKLGLGGSNIRSEKSAKEAMEALKKATNIVSGQRAEYGAMQNRLEHRISSLTTMEENLTAAENRISGADMAKEYMNFMREKMLAEVSSTMMMHVRTQNQQVLTLLR